MASTTQTRKSRDESSSSQSSTSDSTSTTMFVVNQTDLTTTTSEEYDSSSRQVVQGSSSEVEVNVQQGPTVSGFPSQPVPGPSGFNVFLPTGPSVPVIFTEQGIRIPGYNAPAAVPEAEEDGTTTSTTTTEQQEAEDAPVAGIFQLLPAGSYLPTFVNMEQLEEEDEEGDENDELPQELGQEEEPQEEPVQPPLVGIVGASIREQEIQEMFFQMPPQREASPAPWPQAVTMPPHMVPPIMSPPMVSPPMRSPPMVSPAMYSHMQAAQMYASPQFSVPSPMMSFGWQAPMLQGQEQAQAYGQLLGMTPQPLPSQWPAFQAQWAGAQWQLGQPQGQYMQGGPQVPQQQERPQGAEQTEEGLEFVVSSETDRALIRVAEKRMRRVSLAPGQYSEEEFPPQGAPHDIELQVPSSQAPCLDHRVLSTQTSLQHVLGSSGPVAAESSARIDICRKRDKYDFSQAAHVSVSSGQLTTEATQVTQVTHGAEACPVMQDLQPKKVMPQIHDARVQVEDPCVTLGMQTPQEFMGPAIVTSGLRSTEHIHRLAGTQPTRVFSDPQHATHGIHTVNDSLGPPHIALGMQTVGEFAQLPSRAVGLQVTQKRAELPCAADGTHVARGHEEALRPTVGVQIIPQPTGPPHITLEVQATGQPASEPQAVVTGTQTVQERGEPPCLSFGMQTTEFVEPQKTVGITAVQQRLLSPHPTLASHATDMHIQSLQGNVQVQCPERLQVSKSVQATSVTHIPGTTYRDRLRISRTATQVHIPGVPFRRTVCQAVQASSVESLTLEAPSGSRTMVSVEQLQVHMGAHSHDACVTVGSGPRGQQDVGVQHRGILQPVLVSRPPSPARKVHDLEIQCNYEQPMQTTRSITAVRVQRAYEPSDRHKTDFGIQCTFEPRERLVKTITTLPPIPVHDAEVQFSHEPIKEPPPEPPSHDFGVQCAYEPDQMIERNISRAGSRPLHDFMKQGYFQENWKEKVGFSATGRPMRDFEGQYDGPVIMSPIPMTPHTLHETVAIGVGDGGPENIVYANYRFNQELVSRAQSGLSVSSSLSSLFMLGRSHLPGMMNAATQAAEMERYPLSPTFASPAPKVTTTAYPCVAVCSRNTVNHACTLNVSSYPGRLSQTPQMRDAVFQIGEPVPAMSPFGQARSRSLSREPDRRTPFREAAIQTMSAVPPAFSPPLSPPSSPYLLGPFGTSTAGSTPRSGSPTRDAGLQTEGGFTDLRGSPLGGPFEHESLEQLVGSAGGPSHDIMIQADTLTPNAGSAWGPWQVQRRVSVAATAEVYPCSHLPQVLRTRDLPPSPPPLSPPLYSPYPGAQGWQPPVVVENTVGISRDLLRLLVQRQQQNLPPDERPGLAEKGTSEGPFAVWGSTDAEQDYIDQGSSQVEQSSGVGEYLPAGAVLGAAGLPAEADASAKTARRSSIETTSNVTRSTKVASILPEVTVACFLLALLLVLVASAALLSWTTRRHARVVLIGQTTKKALRPSNATYIIPPFSPLQTMDSSLYGKFTTEHTGSPPPGSRTYELCTTDFCVKEGQMLRYLKDSATDPCKNFYEYVCGQWLSQQPSDATYTDVDGALAADIEARMHQFLSGPEKSSIRPLFTFWTNCNRQGATARDRVLSHARSLGLELPGSQASTSPERLMVLAVTLAQEFGLFALLTVELDGDPEGKAQHVLAIDEPELAWGRMKPPMVTTDRTVYWAMLIRAAQPLAALLLSDSGAVHSATHNFARITMAMTNVSVAHRHLSDRMGHYEMHGYRELSRLDPLLNGLFGSSHDLRPSSRVLVKAPRFVELVNKLLSTEREALHEYMVLLALLHLAPFLDLPEAPNMFLGSLTGESVSWGASPPRWRVCLRLAERTLPNLMQMAYEQVFKGSPIFDEVMGDIMVEEVRNGLVEYIESLNLLDAWSKIIAKIKVRNTKVYTFYPIVLADPKNLAAYVRKLERSVNWDGDIMEYYIRLRGFLAQVKERDESLNFFLPRWKHSIFDPECVYYPRRDVVYVPVGFFNLTVPTSPRERMFHVPRAGPRLVACFFRAVLQNTNLYKPEGLWWTEATQAAFQESMACLEERRVEMVYQHRGINLQDASRGLNLQGLSDIEDNVAVRISTKVYDDQLFTNRYLNRDYRLPGVEHLSSKQLFFIYLARSHCEAPSVEKSLEDIRCSYKSKGRYRTNLALSNSREFIDAFQCSPGTEMNPSKQCSVWS